MCIICVQHTCAAPTIRMHDGHMPSRTGLNSRSVMLLSNVPLVYFKYIIQCQTFHLHSKRHGTGKECNQASLSKHTCKNRDEEGLER